MNINSNFTELTMNEIEELEGGKWTKRLLGGVQVVVGGASMLCAYGMVGGDLVCVGWDNLWNG